MTHPPDKPEELKMLEDTLKGLYISGSWTKVAEYVRSITPPSSTGELEPTHEDICQWFHDRFQMGLPNSEVFADALLAKYRVLKFGTVQAGLPAGQAGSAVKWPDIYDLRCKKHIIQNPEQCKECRDYWLQLTILDACKQAHAEAVER